MDDTGLETWFPRHKTRRLGVVVGGSLSKGLNVKLDPAAAIEDMAVGRYVVAQAQGGSRKRFFCMVTDVFLDGANPGIEKAPPDLGDDFLRQVHSGVSVFGTLHIAPMLVLDADEEGPLPVKTVPAHFAEVRAASEEDVNLVFGGEDEWHFHVGEPLDMEDVKVNLDLVRLAERSSGVFGKSGTGKSFLTRLLLAGMLKNDVAVSLIFDMHNDYGWEVGTEDRRRVKGLKQLFPSRVSIFTLDEESSRRRNVRPDSVVTIGFDEIQPEDLEMLRETLNLSDQMIGAAYTLRRIQGKGWISWFLRADSEDIDLLVEGTHLNRQSLDALHRRLEGLERFDFLRHDGGNNAAKKILEHLETGKSVVLEFGRHGRALEAYILVANYLTRRVHEMYVHRMEEALGDASREPPQLVIVVEEAHKFLDPQIARQTIFGVIARELRKYNVTLLVVDQRPSGIDPEVMSQIGTRLTCLLDNERDIQAALTGIPGAAALREVLARLETKQQALIMGHAVPMPVVVQTRSYDEALYSSLGYRDDPALVETQEERVNLLRGEEEEGIY